MKFLSKKRSLFVAISCLIATTPCYAENTENPILLDDGTTHTIVDDSIISVPSASSSNPAILITAPNGGTVNGGSLKIETEGAGIEISLYKSMGLIFSDGDDIINLGTTEKMASTQILFLNICG